MNLYLLTQEQFTGYDAFDSMVVCAEDEDAAKIESITWVEKSYGKGSWADNINMIESKYLGHSIIETREVICASFNSA